MGDPVKKIVILGTGGTSLDILDTISENNKISSEKKYVCVGFLDDNIALWGNKIAGIKVLGPLKDAKKFKNTLFINGIGSPKTFLKKESIISQTGIPLKRFTTIVHPLAFVSPTVKLGYGTVILSHVSVAANAVIGNHVVVLQNSVVGHDCVIGDYSCIAAGVCISGAVEIGASCYMGSNCSLRERISIGDYSLAGMGSVIVGNVPARSVVVGNPARRKNGLVSQKEP